MKLNYVMILIILFVFACQNAPKENTEQTASPAEEIVKVNVQKIEITIEGMTCTGCENTIQNTIKEFDGIYSVTASHLDGKAILEIDSTKADILKIEEAINTVGYKAVGHEKIIE